MNEERAERLMAEGPIQNVRARMAAERREKQLRNLLKALGHPDPVLLADEPNERVEETVQRMVDHAADISKLEGRIQPHASGAMSVVERLREQAAHQRGFAVNAEDAALLLDAVEAAKETHDFYVGRGELPVKEMLGDRLCAALDRLYVEVAA